MGRPLRSAVVIGLLAGLVLALVRALGRETRPLAASLPAPAAPLPAVTPARHTPVPVEVAAAPTPSGELGGESAPWRADSPPSSDELVSEADELRSEAEAEELGSEEPASDAEGPAWVEADEDGGCPEGYPIKAKESSGIFHRPGGASYERTSPDRCYRDAAAAEADGFRAAKR